MKKGLSILSDIKIVEWIKILSAVIVVLKIFCRHKKEFDKIQDDFKDDSIIDDSGVDE